MAPACDRPRRASQRGLLLVEALTAILVFSVGVLGVVALQSRALRHLDEIRARAEASDLARGLIGQMWATDPAALVARYDSASGGTGYRDFAALARRLPGSALAGNEPLVSFTDGPSGSSRTVTVTLRWQAPGEARPHRHVESAVIGRN